MNLDNVTRDDWIVGGLALLLAIVLLLLPWFSSGSVTTPLGTFGGVDLSATDAPDGWLGILAVLAALAIVVDLAVERLSPQTQIPAIGGSRTNTRFILAAAAAGFVVLKFLFHIHFSIFGWGFYVAVLVTAALVYAALQARAGVPIMPSRPAGTAGPSDPPPPSGPVGPAGTGGPGASGPADGVGGSTPPPRP